MSEIQLSGHITISHMGEWGKGFGFTDPQINASQSTSFCCFLGRENGDGLAGENYLSAPVRRKKE